MNCPADRPIYNQVVKENRVGPSDPEDIAEVVGFLASTRNRAVAGETVIASGGVLML